MLATKWTKQALHLDRHITDIEDNMIYQARRLVHAILILALTLTCSACGSSGSSGSSGRSDPASDSPSGSTFQPAPIPPDPNQPPISTFQPAPIPPDPNQPPVQILPDPRDAVTGGGPLTFGDPAAVERMNAQLPNIPADIQITGSDAVSYIKKIVSIIPQLAPTFDALDASVSCAVDYGIIGAKVYITTDLRAAAGILILSRAQLQQLPKAALGCLIKRVTGSGPGANFEPCMRRYYYDSV